MGTVARGSTLVSGLIAALRDRGVRRAFGVPGGGSSLDLIDELAEQGIAFYLTHSETGAALMAAVTAELSGAPGVVITTLGPGAASAVNGIAYAALERAPVLLISDCADDDPGQFAQHQAFDHAALFAPLTKASRRLGPDDGAAQIETLLDTALRHPRGPVHVDLAARAAGAELADRPGEPLAQGVVADGPGTASEPAIAAARALLAGAAKPLIIAGLEAREAPGPAAVRDLASALRCPVMTTYKAKGVFPDTEPQALGCFTGAVAEADCVAGADLLIFCGLDPVELIAHRWRYEAPLLVLSPGAAHTYPVEPSAVLRGALDRSVACLSRLERRSAWSPDEMAALREGLQARLAMPGGSRRTAQDVVEALRRVAPRGSRIAVDSGAHMFSLMSRWQARRPHDVLKSNGLSTMGYALPAAIAAALHEPERPTVACTGDGGLLMCLAELATAARLGCQIVVLVFNDAALSLVDVKQQRQQRVSRGVRYPRVDFAGAAQGLGCRAFRVDDGASLDAALAQAFAAAGPTVVDVALDPAAYKAQLEALRG